MAPLIRGFALVALLSGVGWNVARAQDSARERVDQHLSDGRQLYRDLDFTGCVAAMSAALAVPGAQPAQRLEAYEILGAAYVVLDRPEDAEQAFREMFELDAYHVVREPSGSPKIEQFVEELRARLVPDAALDPTARIDVTLPRATRADRETEVRAEVLGRVATAHIVVRGDDETDWTRLEMERIEAGFEGVIPPRETPGSIDLYVEGRDPQGRVVARGGEPLLPLTLQVRAAESGGSSADVPLRRKWWLWTLVGIVAVGAAVGIGVGVAGGDRAAGGTLPPGRVVLP